MLYSEVHRCDHYIKNFIFTVTVLSAFCIDVKGEIIDDLKNCMTLIFELEEIEPVLFSWGPDSQKVFVIMKEDFQKSIDQSIDIDKLDFSGSGLPIYVEDKASIFVWEIEYWFSFEKIEISDKEAFFKFKTTSWSPVDKYSYIKGWVKLIKGEKGWLINDYKVSHT